jgi:hypothetical protein
MQAVYIQSKAKEKSRIGNHKMASTSETASTPAESSSSSSSKLEFEEYIVERNEKGIWRKCPYCGSKVWDGPHSVTASGFNFHLNTKILAHNEKPEWKLKYGKDSWHLGTQKTKDD